MSKLDKRIFKLTALILSLWGCQQAFADSIDRMKAIAPYIIKPNVPTIAPTGMVPATILKYYGFDQLPNQGEGRTIAIVDAFDNPNVEQDLAVFSQTFNLPPCTTANGCFKKVFSGGSQPPGDTGWGVEIALDVQWAHAIAPKAKIILVETPDNLLTNLFNGVKFALQFSPDVVSMSWGSLEFADQVNFDPIFNVSGVEFTAASMDDGHGVWYPAASPNVIGVGGTRLNSIPGGFNETAWSGSGGGISAFETAPIFQKNFPLPNNPNGMRGVPDISYGADPNTGFSVFDTFGHGGWMVIGGTSAGAPQWAALIAIAKSASSTPLVGIQSMLYSLAKSNYSDNFIDITSGSNGSCGILCNATVGYDYVTGLGSPKAASLIPALVGQLSVNINPSSASVQIGQQQQFTATVTGSSNTSVTWSASGGTVTSSGLYTAPLTTGNYFVTATSVADTTKSAKANVTVVQGPPTDSNLALNQPTIASSELASPLSPAIYATDNDPINTRWTAINSTAGNWLLVDLGSTCNLTGSQVKWQSNGIWKYKVEISPDEVQWNMVVDKSNNTSAAQTYTDNFNAQGRYIRITSLSQPSNISASIYDFEAFGTHVAPPPVNPPINLALNKVTTASTQFSSAFSAAMATDSDTMTTRWCAVNGTNGQWLMVDLGGSAQLTKARVKWESYGVWQYKIETSLDKQNWTLVIDKTANTIPSQTYEDVFSGQGRYVRITATTNQPGHWASIYDFEVFGNI